MPLPASEQTLLRFLASLSLRPGRHGVGLAPSSLQSFMAAIRNLHIMAGYEVPPSSPRIALIIKSSALANPGPVQKSPISFSLLTSMWNLLPQDHDGLMLKAATTLAYYGCLRGCEYGLSETLTGILLNAPPKLSSVSFSTYQDRVYMNFNVPMSKTLIKGFQRVLGCSGHLVCSPCNMLTYLQSRQQLGLNHPDSPLFIWNNLSVLHKSHVNKVIKDLVKRLGLDPSNYTTHSLRSGSVTDASHVLPEHLLKSMGGWKSSQYQTYIRDTVAQHVAIAPALAGLHY